MMGDGLTWNRYLTENVPDGDDVDIVQDGYIKNGEFYKNNPGDGIRVGKYIQKESVSSIKKVRYAQYSKLFPYLPYYDSTSRPDSPTPDSLKEGLILEILGSTDGNNNVWDTSGNDYDGTITNGLTKDSGVIGQSLSLNGTDQEITFADLTSSVTVESACFWIRGPLERITESSYDVFTMWADNVSDSTYNKIIFGRLNSSEMSDETSAYYVTNYNSRKAIYTTVETTGSEWVFVVIVYRTAAPTALEIYINGTAAAGGESSHGIPLMEFGHNARLGSFNTGSSATNYFRQTEIELIRLYDRVLTEDEILELYNNGDGI